MWDTKIFAGIGILALAVSGGLWLGERSWNGAIYLSDNIYGPNDDRGPAAIRHELDFSQLNGAELISATQKRLVTAAHIIIKEGLVGVELGHFVTRDETGKSRLACDMFYNRLTLQFEGNGIATGGEKPQMRIDAPCAPSSQDISSIEPVWIPVAKILKTRANDADLDYSDAKFHFSEMQGQWPPSWSLTSVRLYNTESTARQITISASELHELREHPFVLNWLEAKHHAKSAAKSAIE